MRKVLQLHQLYMFCLERHSVHWILSTRARSRCIVPLRRIHLYLIIPSYSSSALSISNTISSTAQSALTNSSAMNKGGFLGGISIESKNSNNSNDDNYDGGSGATTPLNRTHPHLGLPSHTAFSHMLHPHLSRPRHPPSLASERRQTPAPKRTGNFLLLRQDRLRSSRAVHLRVYCPCHLGWAVPGWG
jgi:hypothetical protein